MKNIPLFEVRQIENLKEMLHSSTELFGSKPAFLVKTKDNEAYQPVSYTQYQEDVDAFGTALRTLGLQGKRIAIIGENRYEWVVSYLATVNGTGVVVPLDKELPVNEIENLLIRSKASAVIFSGQKAEEIGKIFGKHAFIEHYIHMDLEEDEAGMLSFNQLVQKGTQLVKSGDTSFINATIDNEAMTSLLFTSGTTDKSKAVMLSHKNICANLTAMCSMLYIDKSDIFLSVLPIHHTYECTCGFLCQMYRGCTIAFCEGLRHILKNLQESKATMMNAVPLIYEAMYKRLWDQVSKKPGMERKLKLALKLSNLLKRLNIDITKKVFAPIHNNFGGNLRLFISGAAGIDPIVAKGFRDLGILFVQGYGLTECSPIVALNRNVDYKDDAAGLPLPNLEVRIANPNEEGVGEVIIKGPSVMLGYYEDEEATNKVFKDGWFHTGDLAFIDGDGFIHITGRKKNVIVTKNGKNIYPEEIETLLNRSLYIKESLVFGKSDDANGETLVSAMIVPDMERIQLDFPDKEPQKDEIEALIHKEIKAINKTLTLYKHIKDFQMREDEFEKTTTKKIKRYMEKALV